MKPETFSMLVSVLLCVKQHVADVRLARLQRRVDLVVGEHDGEAETE